MQGNISVDAHRRHLLHVGEAIQTQLHALYERPSAERALRLAGTLHGAYSATVHFCRALQCEGEPASPYAGQSNDVEAA